jgi:hypothetical protein
MPVKTCVFAAVVGVVMAASGICAAAPTDSECVAAGTAADQLRNAGKLSAARAKLAACASSGCSGQLRQACARKLAAIDAAMPVVVLEVKDEASNTLSAVRVTMDGLPLVDRLDGSPIAIDPGKHRFVFEAEGFHQGESTFVAQEGQKNLRWVVFLDPARSPPSPVHNRSLVSVTTSPAVPRAEPTNSAERRQKNIGLVLGSVGIGSLAVGTIWAIMSKMNYDHATDSECGGDTNHCSAQGIADGRTAHHQAAVATVGFVGAFAFLTAAAVTYFTAPKPAEIALGPAVTERGGGLTLAGTW